MQIDMSYLYKIMVQKKPAAKKTTKKKPPAKPVEKNWDYASAWSPLGGGFNGLATTYDSFDSERVPSAAELIGAFSDTTFSCATMIASSLAEIDIMLVAEKKAGSAAPDKSSKYWRQPKHRSKAVELHEILDHPALTLLYQPNPSVTWADLISATETYLDVVGRSFWLITDFLDLPTRIDILPAHLVTTERNTAGQVVGYQLGAKQNRDDAPTYKPDQVLAFRNYEYLDPALEGISPVRAVWQKIQLSHKELSSWETIVGQMAHPSVLLSPKDPNAPMSQEGAERFVKEYQQRLARAGQGGPMLLNEALDFNVLSFPPKDQAGLALQDNLKSSICNAFKVPRTLLDQQDANFAGAKAAERSYQLFCLKPRISYILERITQRIVRRFDPSLFLEHVDFVEKDESLEIQRQTLAITKYTSGLAMKNESRSELGLPPDPQGNVYYVAPTPTLPGMGFDQPQPSKSKSADPATKYDRYPLKPVVEVLQKWFGKQKEFALSRATPKAFTSKAWIDLSDFTADMADELRPALMLYYDSAAKSFAQRFGLTDDIWNVTTPKLKEAVERASLHLAESTNATTTLALDEARERLRQELVTGLTSGDTVGELTKRVGSIFESATEERAWLIADSERTRAIGTGELITARASGVVKAKTWLADSRACPLCKGLDGTARDLDEPFAVDQKGGPYSNCQSPPRHPGCRCSMTWQINSEA